jgi:hypothetical protein
MSELWRDWKIETHADDIEIIIGNESKWPVATMSEVATGKRFHIVPNDGELTIVEHTGTWMYSSREWPAEWHGALEYAHRMIDGNVPADVVLEREVLGDG